MDSLATHVSGENLLRHLRALEGERHPLTSPARLAAAQGYVVEQLAQAGLDVSRDEFGWFGSRFTNVIARPRQGSAQPPLLIGAHVDTVTGTPGADDNASGIAVLLETARVIASQIPQAPVAFAAFNLEEEGMIGSAHCAKRLKVQGTRLFGMISLEMVGFTESEGRQQYPVFLKPFYPAVGNFIGLVANRRSTALLKTVEQAMRTVPDLPVETVVLPANGWLLPESRFGWWRESLNCHSGSSS